VARSGVSCMRHASALCTHASATRCRRRRVRAAKSPIYLVYFVAYFGVTALIFFVTLHRIRLLKMLLYYVRCVPLAARALARATPRRTHACRTRAQNFVEGTARIEGRRADREVCDVARLAAPPLCKRPRRRRLCRTIHEINSQSVAFFASTDKLRCVCARRPRR
jgi:hypothetical protein